MRTEHLQESRDTELRLTEVEAGSLSSLGKRLASKTTWWGASDGDDVEPAEKSVIRLRRATRGKWIVRVSDAIGVIAIPGLQITVNPKIPLHHLLLMFAKAGVWPRLDEQRTEIEQSANLMELIATWFLSSVEILLRQGLIRDYEEVNGEEPAIRGRLELVPTAAVYYSGRLAFRCEYEEFTHNTPLNRLIGAAAQSVVAAPLLKKEVRARAMRVAARVEDAGDVKASDFAAVVDRRTAHYRDPVLLAKAVLRHMGRTPLEGGYTGWSFLIRTPETVEDAMRLFLAEAMPNARIRKGGRQLEGTALTLNPDLVFGESPTAVGDVKYKLSSGEWNRVDLYQLVAFGTGFRVPHALLTRFREAAVHPCRDLIVGDLHVSERTWPADPLIPAAVAAAQFVDGVRHWINLQESSDPTGA